MSMRVGPEAAVLPTGAAIGGRGTFAFGIGSASGDQGTQLAIPISGSASARFDNGKGEGAFESGVEYTSVGSRFGFRGGVRVGSQLGQTSGGYLGIRGGPVLMLRQVKEGQTTPALTLEGLLGVGTGGDVKGGGVFGACLSFDLDFYSKFNLNLPHGRPLRHDDGSTWRATVRLGRRRSAALGQQLTPAERERVGLSYLEDGLDEHASVPAFERLALELAQHRAPHALIARARAAATEETRHARSCFALATAYLGRDVQVPNLPHTRIRRARSLLEIARESWWDGCIGEAAAANVVLARATQARDSSERQALRGIARDEQGHARLAADVVAWALRSSRRG